MRKIIVALMVGVALTLSACGGVTAPTKQVQTQVASDIKAVSEVYQCAFVEKSLDLVGQVTASDGSGKTIFIYRVSYTYDCTASTANSKAKGKGDVFYFATVDKNGKVVSIN